MRALRRVLVASSFAALLSMAACSSILGIDFPPLLVNGEDGGDASSDVASLDAGGDVALCPLNEPLPCRAGCPHAFCDDFEEAGALFPRWSAPAGVINPVVLGDGSVGTTEPGASSSSHALAIEVHGGTKSSAALLFHLLPPDVVGDPMRVDGIRVAFDALVAGADLADAGGPGPDAGGSPLAFLGTGTDRISASGLGFTEQDLFLVASTDLLRGGKTELAQPVNDGSGTLKIGIGIWTRFSLFAGTSVRGRALGYGACPDAPYVFAASWLVAKTCVAAPASFSLASLPSDPTLIFGTILRGPGQVSLRYDNVFVDVFTAP